MIYNVSTKGLEEVDHIVVGAGTAGCTVAARLAERGASVLLIEAGGSDASWTVRVPAAGGRLLGQPHSDWSHVPEPDASLGGRVQRWNAGRLLGGTSSINGMLFVRGHPADYDAWAAAGNAGWDFASLLPLWRRLEATPLGDAHWRGRDGPLPVSEAAARHPLCDAVAEALQACGVPATNDYNGAQFEGVAAPQVTQRRGLRVNAARAYLVASRPTIRLVLRALATRLVFDGDRCVGVEWVDPGRPSDRQSARCRGDVIVCAGAVGSPRLLLLSGIGPANELEALGVRVRCALPGVGRGLREHPTALVTVGVNESTYGGEVLHWRALGHALAFAAQGRGPIAAPHAHLLAHVCTRPELTQPDAQIAFYPFSFERIEQGGARLARADTVLFSLATCQGSANGRVSLRSSDPAAAPRIEHQLLSERGEVDTLISASRLLDSALNADAMRRRVLAVQAPIGGSVSDAERVAWLRDTAVLSYHAAGTCRMGSDALAVVDATLAVRGVRGLRVADNSVMPRLTSGNTQAPAYLIGEKAADLIRPVSSGSAAAAPR
jgi:choline dehydrogenase